jgi:hypothetical protein
MEKDKKYSLIRVWDETKGLFVLAGLCSLVVIPGAYISHGVKTNDWSLNGETKIEISDSSKIKNVDTSKVYNLSFEDALFYKNLGIENTKQYNQKQLDSLVSEAYRNVLW